MDPITRFSLSLWYLLKSLPPVSAGRLLAPAVFLCAWTVLITARLPAPQAFVIAAVLAQALHIWQVMPESFRTGAPQAGASSSGRGGLAQVSSLCLRSVSLLMAFFALEVVLQSPRFVQGVVSFYALVYALVMLRGSLKTGAGLDPYCAQSQGAPLRDALRQHFCKLYALCALTVVAVNEATAAAQMPLEHRVVVLALLPLALHYVFAIMVFLTLPPFDAADGKTDP